MIVTEQFTINGKEFVRTYSDAGRYVVRDGIAYAEANDPADLGRVYTEGELMPVDGIERQTQEILDILTGVSE